MHTTSQQPARPRRTALTSHPSVSRPASMLRSTPDAQHTGPQASAPLLGKKTDVLHYYRQQNLGFLNLGSVLIGISDHLLYHFDALGRVDWVTELPG